MAIEQADNVQTGAPKPTDSRYYNNLLPWVDEAAAKAGIGSGVRYSGLTVNIAGTEWWWKDGITDPDLVVKESGGGTLNMSGSTVDGLTTYVDGTTICAQSGLTFTNNTLSVTGDISATGATISDPGACTFASLPAYINTDGTISTGSTLSDIYHTLGKLSPATFPYVDGTYTVSAETVINASDTDYTIRIIPDDSSYTVHYGYTTADGYRNRTQSTNLTFLLTTQDTADRFGTYYMYLPKDGVGTASETEYGNEPTPVPDGRFLLASMRFRNSGNAAGEIIEITNYSRTELGISGGTSSGGGITMDGSTVNGITTYVDADTICANSHLQWDGNNLNLSGATTESKAIQIGVGRTGDGYTYLDFVGDTTYTDYGLRILRSNSGANTDSLICHRGTGKFDISTQEAGNIVLATNNVDALTIDGSTQKVCINKCLRVNETNYVSGAVATIETTSNCHALVVYGWSGSSTTNYGLVVSNAGGNVSAVNYGIYSNTYRSAGAVGTGRSHGIYGVAGNQTNCYNWGNIGILCGTNYGAGVYGSVGAFAATTDNIQWAGYFKGPVRGTTSICATTCVRSPVVCATTCVRSPVVCATTCVRSPVVCATTCVGVDGNIRFSQGTDKCIVMDTATDGGAGDSINVCGGAGDTDSTPGGGGNVRICGGVGGGGAGSVAGAAGGYSILYGGTGGAGDPVYQGGAGGAAYVRGGAGGSGAGYGVGGHVYVCGGCSYTNDNAGGHVYICSGAGSIDGCVMLYHDTTKRLHTTTTGMYTTGVHCSSTCSRSNYHYSVVCACSPVHCATTAFRAASAGYKFCSTSGCGCAVDWVATSDCRMKKCIEPIISALSKVDALCGVCYEFCGDGTLDMGLIAQDVEKIEPRLVSKGEADEYHKEKYGIEDETLGLKYDKFAGLFVEAIKELKEQNICLQNQINELRKIK